MVCLDAATGELLWMHRYDEGERGGSRGGPGLGVGYWTDGTNERILYVTRGYSMFSLDAKTGIPDPAFGTDGMVDLRLNDDQDMDPDRGVIGLHATPLVVKDAIVVGAAPTARCPKAMCAASTCKTGKRKWIFHTIPRKGEFGYDTWITPGQAEAAGNTGVWAPMSADPELGLVYVAVELPQTDTTGHHPRRPRPVRRNAGGARHRDRPAQVALPDRSITACGTATFPAPAILCDIPHNGKIVKALAQPTKQGYLYVLDRATGKPVWPIPEKPVAKGDVPGEWYSPTQPMPSKPPPFDQAGRDRGRPGRLHAGRSRRARWRSPAITTWARFTTPPRAGQATSSSAR